MEHGFDSSQLSKNWFLFQKPPDNLFCIES